MVRTVWCVICFSAISPRRNRARYDMQWKLFARNQATVMMMLWTKYPVNSRQIGTETSQNWVQRCVTRIISQFEGSFVFFWADIFSDFGGLCLLPSSQLKAKEMTRQICTPNLLPVRKEGALGKLWELDQQVTESESLIFLDCQAGNGTKIWHVNYPMGMNNSLMG